MTTKDTFHDLAVVQLLAPIVVSATGNSLILDTKGYESALLVLDVGVVTAGDAANFVAVTVEECDTTVTGSFTTVAAADLICPDANTAGDWCGNAADNLINSTTLDAGIYTVGYRGTKRYIRVHFAETLTFSATMSVVGILSNARHWPVTAPAAVAAT